MIISQPARKGKKKDANTGAKRETKSVFGASPSTMRGLFEASLNTMFLFRRRNNENSERDALRHDVISFGVEPLTKRSQGKALLSAAATV